MKKFLLVLKIKPEFREEYIAIHKSPWCEMLEAIRDAGFINEVIWYFEDQSIVYLECENFEACNTALRITDVCKQWDVTVGPWLEAAPSIPEKIFDLNQQLDGVLLPD